MNNVPIEPAVEDGATEIWVLATGYACNLERPPRGALAMILHAVSLLVQQRLIRDVQQFQSVVDLAAAGHLRGDHLIAGDFTTTDRDEYSIYRICMLSKNFLSDGALTSNNIWIIKRMNKSQPTFFCY